ncbi:MAG: NAD(+) diphosphatase [Propionicimonas sp.]|nr:NAD(+) diphosphatase [Propionicimonas sp.]
MISWCGPSLLDRAEDRRGDDDWVASQWRAPGTRVIAVTPDGSLGWAGDGPGFQPASGELSERHLLLGLLEGRAVFADVLPDLAAGRTLRAVMDGLSEPDLEVAFAAAGLAAWHSRAAFCGSCGSATAPVRAGLERRCTGCGRELYPRVDPAVIVAVTDDDDRLLLGRQPSWPAGRMSVFAGFVEAGESLEQAVHREVFEEVGLRLAEPTYLGSQPWPFPRSMMVGFAARAVGTALTVDNTEIEHARWFSRSELTAALAAGEVGLPMSTSIASGMIGQWREERLGAVG